MAGSPAGRTGVTNIREMPECIIEMAKGGKASTVNQCVDIKARNSCIVIGRHFHFDVTWVTASINPVHFLSVKGNAHRSAGFAGKNSSTHFVRERI